MPNNKRRKVIAKKDSRTTVAKKSIQPSTFRWGESYTSLLLGIIVVIIGILFVVSLARTQHVKQVTSIATNVITATQVPVQTATPIQTQTPTPVIHISQPIKPSQQMMEQKNQQEYTVSPGDDLWHISEKFYKSGYNYVDIARANHLENPSTLYSGMKLTIPQIQQITPEPQTVTPTVSQQTIAQQNPLSNEQVIKTGTYTIQKGDDLWNIAVRAYNDGYKWPEIAQANGLTNPELIHSGNILKIPR